MKVNEKMKKALSILLCLCMLVQNCPVVAFATEEETPSDPAVSLCAHENPEANCASCVAEIQAMVDALPDMDHITGENREDVISQLEAIDSRKWKLSDEALGGVNFGKYTDAAFVLSDPEGFFGSVQEADNGSGYTVTLNPTEHGTVSASIDGQPVESGASVAVDEYIDLTITPEVGYVLDELSVTYVNANGDTVDADIFDYDSFNMPAGNVTVTASFKQCTNHSYSNGACHLCGTPCTHPSYLNGECEICWDTCPHESLEDNGSCKACDMREIYIVTEDWESCSILYDNSDYIDAVSLGDGLFQAMIPQASTTVKFYDYRSWDTYRTNDLNMPSDDSNAYFVSDEGIYNGYSVYTYTGKWAKYPCAHQWADGICTACGTKCGHSWEEGTCTECDKVCSHPYWDSGNCYDCGTPCVHPGYQEGQCTTCEYICPHESLNDNGSCKACDLRKIYIVTGGWESCRIEYDNITADPLGDGVFQAMISEDTTDFYFIYFDEYDCSHKTDYLNLPGEDSNAFYVGEVIASDGWGGYTYTGKWAKYPCTHQWADDVCTECGTKCGHIWSEGTCTVCGTNCKHIYWVSGKCYVCNTACQHSSYENGKCAKCSTACPEHELDEKEFCTICDMRRIYVDVSYWTDCRLQTGSGYTFLEFEDGVYSVLLSKNATGFYFWSDSGVPSRTDELNFPESGENCYYVEENHTLVDGTQYYDGQWGFNPCVHQWENSKCTICGAVCSEHSTEKEENKANCARAAVCDTCGASLGEVDKSNHDETVAYENGFCPNGCYESAVLNDGVYEISNAGQLYWFAAKVNSGNVKIDGKLMQNIVVNQNVLQADGSLNGVGSNFRAWTPIGKSDSAYDGTFDGSGHTVSGLYFNNSEISYVGLFGYTTRGSKVQNLGVTDSYFKGKGYVGGVVGYNYATVINCYNTGTVSGSSHVGGVVGNSNSTVFVTNCYNTGTVSGSSHVGGVVGNSNSTVTGCYNTGTVSGTSYVGGMVGSSIHPAGFVTDCYNTGAVSGSSNVGGVAGSNSGTITNGYSSGTVSGSSNVGGVAGYNGGTITNCYYDKTVYAGNAAGLAIGTATKVEGKTTDQFASGEVAYLLNGDQTEIVFKQTIGTDLTPKFTGNRVYYGYTSCGDDEMVYTNEEVSQTRPAHSLAPTCTDNGNGTHRAVYPCCNSTVNEDHSLTYSARDYTITESCAANCGHTGTAAIRAANATYSGDEQKTATVVYSEGWMGEELTVSYKNNVNAGTATASITAGEATASVDFTIAKANPSFIKPLNLTATYGDTLASVNLNNAPNMQGALSWNDAPTTPVGDAGTHTFKATYTPFDTTNYNTVEMDLTVVVARKEIIADRVLLETASCPYDGTAKKPGVSISMNLPCTNDGTNMDGAEVTLEENKDFTVTYSDNVNAGTATVTIQGIGNFTGTVTRNFTITKAPLTVTADNKTMITGQSLPTFTYTITGFVSGETEEVLTTKPTVGCTADGQTAGSYDITVDGAEAVNYSFSYVKGTLSVVDHQHAWTYTAEGNLITATCGNGSTCPDPEQSFKLNAPDAGYSGNPVEAEVTRDSTDLTYTLHYAGANYDSDDAPTNAGDYTVTMTVGDQHVSDTFTINPKNIANCTGSLRENTFTYSGEAPELTVTVVDGGVGNTTLTKDTDYTVGTVQVNAGSHKLILTGKGNYTGSVELDYTITAKEVTITGAEIKAVNYDPNGYTLTVTDVTFAGVVQGENLDYTASAALGNTNAVGVQDAAVTVTLNDSNYTLVTATYQTKVTINKAAAATTTAPAEKTLTYKGEAQNLVSGGTSNDGRVVYSLTEKGTFTESIPVGTNAGEYTVWYYVVGDANHSDSEKTSVKVSIAKAKLDVTVTAGNKVYDGTTAAALEVKLNGVIQDDSVAVEGITAQFSDANAGQNKTVVIDASNAKLTGEKASNYVIDQVNSTTTAAITKIPVAAPAAGVGYTLDYAKETITVAEGFEVADPEGKTVTSGSAANYLGQTLKVRVKETDNEEASQWTSFPVSARPAQPNVTVQNETLKGKENGAVNGMDSTMEYSTDNGSHWIPVENASAITGLKANTVIQVRVKATAAAPHGEAKICTVAAGTPITVTYDSNGQTADGMPAQVTNLSYSTRLTRPADPAAKNTDFAFRGWYKDAACTNAWDFDKDAVAEESVTIYAKWEQVYFSVEADIYRHDGQTLYTDKVHVRLMRGDSEIAQMEGIGGKFKFEKHVQIGMYNLVAVYTDEAGAHTKTELITVDHDGEYKLILPEAGVNSHLTVSGDAQTPDVMVGNLDAEAEAVKQEAGTAAKVEVEMTVTGKTEDQVSDAVVTAVKTATSNATVEYLDITVTRQINDGEKTKMSVTSKIMEILVPYNADGKTDLRVFRHHGGQLQEFVNNTSGNDRTFFYANGYIHIFTQYFSNYMITYEVSHTVQFHANGGAVTPESATTRADGTLASLPTPTRDGYVFKGWYTAASGGTEVTTSYVFRGDAAIYAQWSGYAITVADTSKGTVSVDRSEASGGTKVTITVTPKYGYKMETLTVKDSDGKSYPVSTDNKGKYSFTMPNADATVKATFHKISTHTPDHTNPKTGDDFQLVLWSGIAMTSLLCMAALVLGKKRFYQR